MSDRGEAWDEEEAEMVSSPRALRLEHAGQPRLERVPMHTAETQASTRVVTHPLIAHRDRKIVTFVSQFDQVTAAHIRRVIFRAHPGRTNCQRALKRLLKQKILARIEVRTVGGAHGGSGQYVYQLGYAGYKMADMEVGHIARSVKYHSLAIADVYADLYAAQDDHFKIITHENEPDTHRKINGIAVLPDLTILRRLGNKQRPVWFEIDLDTERPKQLRDKLSRYHRAWAAADEGYDPWPLIVWAVPDTKRKLELEALISQQPKESQIMYRVALFGDVVETVTN